MLEIIALRFLALKNYYLSQGMKEIINQIIQDIFPHSLLLLQHVFTYAIAT